MKALQVVGMGPGGLEHLTRAALDAIGGSDILAGAARHLALFPDKEPIVLGRGLDDFFARIDKARRRGRVALLVTGDPGIHSLLAQVRRRYAFGDYVVVPGISSFQLAFARLGLGWEEARIVSVHGRDMKNLERLSDDSPGVVLLDESHGAAQVAAALAPRLGGGRRCVIACDLGLPGETIEDTTLAQASRSRMEGLCLLILP